MIKRFAALTLAVALVGTTAFADSKGKGSVGDFQKSYQVAAGASPSGILVSSRVEVKSDGSQVYGFYFYDPKSKTMFEREISADGKIVKDTSKDTPNVKNPKKDENEVSKDMLALLEKKITGKAKLPEGRLFEIAAGQLKDATIESMQLVKDGDNLVMSFGDVKINAETGAIIPVAPTKK